MKNSQLPAMPQSNHELVKAFMSTEQCAPNGLTKREMMAMHMMASLTNTYMDNITEYHSGKDAIKCQSETAVEMVDALLAELEK